jgi:mRNA-degrading endonuclease toxin of MazEF toxin-antitoxin module
MIKGEIWWANLTENPYGSEPGKCRPVLIIQKIKQDLRSKCRCCQKIILK